MKSGGWVMLRNIHLCPSWLGSLEKRLESSRVHDQFRLFLTAEIQPAIPRSLIRKAHVLVVQPPAGIKASLHRSLTGVPAARIEAQPAERARLYFLLAWVHAIVLERLRYTPIGWSKAYEFGEPDFSCGLAAIDDWLAAAAGGAAHIKPSAVPWAALRKLLGVSFYGGRIDNQFDDQLLGCVIDSVFVEASFSPDFALVTVDDQPFFAPDPALRTKAELLDWVDDSVPDTASPAWLGLSLTADERVRVDLATESLQAWKRLCEDDSTDAVPVAEMGAAAMEGVDPVRSRVADWCQSALEMLPTHLSIADATETQLQAPLFRSMRREVLEADQILLKVCTLMRGIHSPRNV